MRYMRDLPAWAAASAMFLTGMAILWLGGDRFLDKGYGQALGLLAVLSIAWLCRRMTMEVYGVLVLVGLLVGAVIRLLDADGWVAVAAGAAVVIGTAYLIGDRPLQRSADSASRTEQVEH